MEQSLGNQPKINVGKGDRMVSLGAGALLAMIGIRRSWTSMLVTAIGGYLVYRALTGNCKVYEMFDLDSTGKIPERNPISPLLEHNPIGGLLERTITVEEAITVNRPPAEVYLFWRNLENLPRFMDYLQSVTVHGPKRSHWVAKTPVGGVPMEWDAEITDEQENERIAWSSVPDSTLKNSGAVRFTPALDGIGTEVHVRMEYTPPGGGPGAAVARILNRFTAGGIKEDLRRFKETLETGATAKTQDQPATGVVKSNGGQPGTSTPATPKPSEPRGRDVVHDASEDSFPASDAPAYSSGID